MLDKLYPFHGRLSAVSVISRSFNGRLTVFSRFSRFLRFFHGVFTVFSYEMSSFECQRYEKLFDIFLFHGCLLLWWNLRDIIKFTLSKSFQFETSWIMIKWNGFFSNKVYKKWNEKRYYFHVLVQFQFSSSVFNKHFINLFSQPFGLFNYRFNQNKPSGS